MNNGTSSMDLVALFQPLTLRDEGLPTDCPEKLQPELQYLAAKGFHDKNKNVYALNITFGNVSAALLMLSQNQV